MRGMHSCDSPSSFSSETTNMEDRRQRRRKRNVNNGKNPRYMPKISRNVHSDINFSELNEVCLDVGKVDLSHSARLSDPCLSPHKLSPEVSIDVQFDPPNGCLEEKAQKVFSTKKPEKDRNMRSCFVQLEGLELQKGAKRNIFPSTHKQTSQTSTELKIPEEEGWRGWVSTKTYIHRLQCNMITVQDEDMFSHVLVFGDDGEGKDHCETSSSVESASLRDSDELSLSSDDSMSAFKIQKSTDTAESQHSNSSVCNDILGSGQVDLQVSVEDQSLRDNGYNSDAEGCNEGFFLKCERECLSDEYDGNFFGWDAGSKKEAEQKRRTFMRHFRMYKRSTNKKT